MSVDELVGVMCIFIYVLYMMFSGTDYNFTGLNLYLLII